MSSSIHEKIRKLLALAADAGAGEAETAAAMAARLMAEHAVSLADVAASETRQKPSVGCRQIPVSAAIWESMLVHVVARSCGGVVIRQKAGRETSLLVYAPEAVIDSMLDLAAYLRLQVLREAAKEAARVRPERVRAWKRSFIVGAISRAGERLREQRRQVAEASRQAGTALATLDHDVERHVASKHPRLKTGRRILVGAGFGDGRAAGDRLDVGVTPLRPSEPLRLR